MKKVAIIVAIVVVVLAVIFAVINLLPQGTGSHDGTSGIITFDKLSSEIGYGFDASQGEFPMDVEIAKGSLNIKITGENNYLFEKNDITNSEKVALKIPETGYYFITLSGKKASGTIKYPVSDTASTPVINGVPLKGTDDNEEIVRNAVTDYLKKGNEPDIEDVIFDNVKVYSKAEIESDELLSDLGTSEKDIIFEIDYRLKISEDCEDMMQYTAGTGEIDGQWVKNKYNCGIATYDSAEDKYMITNFGTGF